MSRIRCRYRYSDWCLVVTLAGLVLSGCGSKPLQRAPVEDRSVVSSKAAVEAKSGPAKAPAPVESANKPGYYTVKPGDNLIRIGMETGQSHVDIARWNAIANPNLIEVGQVLRVVPPASSASSSSDTVTIAISKPVTSSSVQAMPLPNTAAKPSSTASAPTSAASGPAASVAVTSAASDEDMGWIWPNNGPILAGFDEVKNKGLDIGGSVGDAVVAAADGKVVYSGSGLRGYGNLIILKHNSTYLTAYAHNQTLLVKEDQVVKKGQKIAEMGNSDTDRVKLHFEVRKQGKPVDPSKYLSAR
ncbi:MAG: peptidoglycan DD-metalloendopeptidase family protein [Rhodoferax sp.]|nr:peptidoglycan DD-metalloendopeptidase family protein [Rhodoferax sp.]